MLLRSKWHRRGGWNSHCSLMPPFEKGLPSSLAAIKRITGVSWEKIGSVLGCTGQNVYNWTRGEQVKVDNAASSHSFVKKMVYIDRGSQAKSRARARGSSHTYPHWAENTGALMEGWRPLG
ncbi:hypothetical protein FHT77_004050 [Rhizobium sp. BK181]|nr:hypothetical protein [Rhizobium sp. BK181]